MWGTAGLGNRLVVSNGAIGVGLDQSCRGDQPSSANNRVVVGGGTLRVTNATGTGRTGRAPRHQCLTGGLIEADQLF